MPAWAAFNRAVASNGDVGIWHETYRVRPGDYECIYNNMPLFGLAQGHARRAGAGPPRVRAGAHVGALVRTERLLLRRWRPSDLAPFAALNADPRVMRYFPSTLSRAESDAFAERIEAHFAEHGFGLWAVEILDGAPFIGFVGLSVPRFEAPFTPCVEVGWRLAAEYWGRGYAPEGGARRARIRLRYARAATRSSRSPRWRTRPRGA